jgi:C7-cyclitol 7-kinase
MDCVVFDVGGTTLRAARYLPAEGRLERIARVAAPTLWNSSEPGFESIWHRLRSEMTMLVESVLEGRNPDIVAVAFPGPLDPNGMLLAAPTVWGSLGNTAFPLRDQLASLWPDTVVLVLNDVTAAGYRYVSLGVSDFCLVTVSSGIGNKVFLGGSPVVGPFGRGGEIGHLRVDYSGDALECDCGVPGHLGAVGSGRGVLAAALRRARISPEAFSASVLARKTDTGTPRFDSVELAAAFRAGDAWATDVIDHAAAGLGRALAAIHAAIGVERFIIIGGFAFSLGESYRLRVVAAAALSCWSIGQDWDQMATFGIDDDDAGLLGAGHYAMRLRGGQ